VEALHTVYKQVGASTRVIHVFDREGDIAEVFEQVRQLEQVVYAHDLHRLKQ